MLTKVSPMVNIIYHILLYSNRFDATIVETFIPNFKRIWTFYFDFQGDETNNVLEIYIFQRLKGTIKNNLMVTWTNWAKLTLLQGIYYVRGEKWSQVTWIISTLDIIPLFNPDSSLWFYHFIATVGSSIRGITRNNQILGPV